jgi:hypothetical protein
MVTCWYLIHHCDNDLAIADSRHTEPKRTRPRTDEECDSFDWLALSRSAQTAVISCPI